MWASVVQRVGRSDRVPSAAGWKGPFSSNAPSMDEQPGPPFSQSTTGASGPASDSANT